MMEIGYIFFEYIAYQGSQLLNPGLLDYCVSQTDLSEEMRSILVENGDGSGPFGSKDIGESGLCRRLWQ